MSDPSLDGARRGFITGGSWCVDRNKLIAFWPEEDSICEILSEERRNGGSGSNLAIDMKKLTHSLVKLVLPAATAKATPVRGTCGFGCGVNGVLSARTADGRRPCC